MQRKKRNSSNASVTAVFSLTQDFPVYSINGNHARTVQQHRREMRKKRALKNFMTCTRQEEEWQLCECNGGFFIQAGFSGLQC